MRNPDAGLIGGFLHLSCNLKCGSYVNDLLMDMSCAVRINARISQSNGHASRAAAESKISLNHPIATLVTRWMLAAPHVEPNSVARVTDSGLVPGAGLEPARAVRPGGF